MHMGGAGAYNKAVITANSLDNMQMPPICVGLLVGGFGRCVVVAKCTSAQAAKGERMSHLEHFC